MKGGAGCPPGSRRSESSSVRFPGRAAREEKRHKWSAGRRACRSKGTRHLSKVPDQDVAPNGAPLPLWREEGNEGGAPRLTTSGADESRLLQCRRDAP